MKETSKKNKGITAVIANITQKEKIQDDELIQQKTEIGLLREKIIELEIINERRQSSQDNVKTIGAVDHFDSSRSGFLDRRPQLRDSRVRFSRSPLPSRDSSYSRSQDRSLDRNYSRERNNSYSRDQSPAPRRDNYNRNPFYSRDNQRRSFSNPPQNWNNSRQHFSSNRFSSQRPGRFNQNNNQRPINNSERRQNFSPNYNNQTVFAESNSLQQNNNRQNKSDIVCFKCNKPGHIARECWSIMARMNHPRGQNN